MKADGGEVSQGTERSPFVAGEKGLRRIFDDEQIVAPRNGEDRVHVAANAGVVHGNDGARARPDRGFNHTFINVERVRPHVHEDRRGTAQHEGVGR